MAVSGSGAQCSRRSIRNRDLTNPPSEAPAKDSRARGRHSGRHTDSASGRRRYSRCDHRAEPPRGRNPTRACGQRHGQNTCASAYTRRDSYCRRRVNETRLRCRGYDRGDHLERSPDGRGDQWLHGRSRAHGCEAGLDESCGRSLRVAPVSMVRTTGTDSDRNTTIESFVGVASSSIDRRRARRPIPSAAQLSPVRRSAPSCSDDDRGRRGTGST